MASKKAVGAALQVQRSTYYHHGGRPGSTQADTVLEKLREFCIQSCRQQEERDPGSGLALKPQSSVPVTKATPPNPFK